MMLVLKIAVGVVAYVLAACAVGRRLRGTRARQSCAAGVAQGVRRDYVPALLARPTENVPAVPPTGAVPSSNLLRSVGALALKSMGKHVTVDHGHRRIYLPDGALPLTLD